MKVWLTVAYLTVMMGSLGLLGLVTEFSSSPTKPWEWKFVIEKALGLFDGYQVWLYSWRLIIIGTLMQLAAQWIWE